MRVMKAIIGMSNLLYLKAVSAFVNRNAVTYERGMYEIPNVMNTGTNETQLSLKVSTCKIADRMKMQIVGITKRIKSAIKIPQ